MKKQLFTDKSNIHGRGLFSKNYIKKGEHIAYVSGVVKKFRSSSKSDAASIPTWYGVSRSRWIDPGKSVFAYFNHSCDPNTAIIGTKKVVAKRDIPKNTELTVDYSFTDADINWILTEKCNCGSKYCRKKIKSIQSLPLSVVKRHFPLIPRYFLNVYLKSNPNVTIVGNELVKN